MGLRCELPATERREIGKKKYFMEPGHRGVVLNATINIIAQYYNCHLLL